MNIDEALKVTGFELCEFTSEEDVCSRCEKEIPKGENVYYERTCHEVDEGEYYCTDCTINTPKYWEEESAVLEAFFNTTIRNNK